MSGFLIWATDARRKKFSFSLRQSFAMYFLFIALILPSINAVIVVKIHLKAYFVPKSPCALLQTDTLPTGASWESCAWQCQYKSDCQTSVYDEGSRVCTMFSELCSDEQVRSSTNEQSSVICNRKMHRMFGWYTSTISIVDEFSRTSDNMFIDFNNSCRCNNKCSRDNQ